ncbi:transmembrane protein, putative (macronuclear) [Tetrahymena thermophila SB210]|uniref:Transmembrane protein, putative n=1 Tax=Tetrahymena thermophila (strain SB210) TaxID=312017 RepID=W7X600_TETTS|nr:transmembrane protein, putative [Tetrahymena thermophila SB210]EWS72802.1 transmembrane protein, putative [Tetrahymena thermophila SB210]|eukprot:XP_012654661.1 transmembrane protein, putative [Tetrahymena thermophila SB210]
MILNLQLLWLLQIQGSLFYFQLLHLSLFLSITKMTIFIFSISLHFLDILQILGFLVSCKPELLITQKNGKEIQQFFYNLHKLCMYLFNFSFSTLEYLKMKVCAFLYKHQQFWHCLYFKLQ